MSLPASAFLSVGDFHTKNCGDVGAPFQPKEENTVFPEGKKQLHPIHRTQWRASRIAYKAPCLQGRAKRVYAAIVLARSVVLWNYKISLLTHRFFRRPSFLNDRCDNATTYRRGKYTLPRFIRCVMPVWV